MNNIYKHNKLTGLLFCFTASLCLSACHTFYNNAASKKLTKTSHTKLNQNKLSQTKISQKQTNHAQQIIGIWHSHTEAETLVKMGLSKSQSENSQMQMQFFANQDVHIRSTGMPTPVDNPFVSTAKNGVTTMKGRYIIKKTSFGEVLAINIGRDQLEDQQIIISDKQMQLIPLEQTESIVFRFQKTPNWTLKPSK